MFKNTGKAIKVISALLAIDLLALGYLGVNQLTTAHKEYETALERAEQAEIQMGKATLERQNRIAEEEYNKYLDERYDCTWLKVNEDYREITAYVGDVLPDLDSIFSAHDVYIDKELEITYEGAEHYNTEKPGEALITATVVNELGMLKSESITLIVKEKPVVPQTTAVVEVAEVANTNGFTYFSQKDPRWAYEYVGTSQLRTHGCGACTTAMLLSWFGYYRNPLEMAQELHEAGYYSYGEFPGTRSDAIEVFGPRYGLNVWTCWNGDELYDALANGAVAICGINYYGYGHQIFCVGVDSNGMTTVYDPAAGIYQQDVWSISKSRLNDVCIYAVSR